MVRDLRGPVAEVVLDSVSVFEGRRVAQRFREAEVELVGAGTEGDLQHIGAILRAAGARESDGRPKVFRALGLEVAPEAKPLESTASALDRVRPAPGNQSRHARTRTGFRGATGCAWPSGGCGDPARPGCVRGGGGRGAARGAGLAGRRASVRHTST
jgi:hypothetical protein